MCACSEAQACCGITEPFKPAPDFGEHLRHLQGASGCGAVSPSPPSPSPLPLPPSPTIPPLPPFLPTRDGEQVIEVEVITVTTDITLEGSIADIDQDAVYAGLSTLLGCTGDCVLRLAYAEATGQLRARQLQGGSVLVEAEASVPSTDTAAVAATASAMDALTTTNPDTIGDAVGVRVLAVSPQVLTAARTMAMVLIAPPPPSPPSPPPPSPPAVGGASESSEESDMMPMIASGGGAVVLILAIVGCYCYMKSTKNKNKVAPHSDAYPTA